jgi:hypothetical protein
VNSQEIAVSKIQTLLATTSGLQAEIAIAEGQQLVQASFKAKNSINFNTVKAKAADAEYLGLNIKLNIGTAEQYPLALENVANSEDKQHALVSLEDRGMENFHLPHLATANKEMSDLLLKRLSTDLKALQLNDGESFTSFGINAKVHNGVYRFIESLVSSDKQIELGASNIFSNLIALDNNLPIERVKEIHDQLYLDFPILKGFPIGEDLSSNKPLTLLEVLQSRVFSNDAAAANEVMKFFVDKPDHHPALYKDIFATIALGIARGKDFPIAPQLLHYDVAGSYLAVERSEPLRIIHVKDKSELENYQKIIGLGSDVGGAYSLGYNLFVFEDARSFIHEATHAIMNLLMNNESNPYQNNSCQAYQDYQSAKVTLLSHIAAKLGLDAEGASFNAQKSEEILQSITRETFIDIFAAAKKGNANFLYHYFDLQKHFPGLTTAEITHELIKKKATEEMHRLNLSDQEANIIGKLGILMLNYKPEDFDKELIATLPELYISDRGIATVDSMFAPLQHFWNQHIHPQIEVEINVHNVQCEHEYGALEREQCAMPGLVEDKIYVHCIEDFWR